ncbi:MAG TPA: phospholipase D family protein, partial [Nocardioidaceae bacterium]|nr:phospholipase D family protein [Nocardioidaceae bacterium]
MARRARPDLGDDLFSLDEAEYIEFGLSTLRWPDQSRFPVNLPRRHVRDMVDTDLQSSKTPLLVAGYSSIAALIELVASWRNARSDGTGSIRLVLGSEPFPSRRPHFASAREEFTEEVRSYWLERSVSVRLSAKVLRTLEELDRGSLQVRVIPGHPALHAKIYAGDGAATVGSSNYTDFGMAHQLEANARFEAEAEPERFAELTAIARNFW